MKTLVILSPLRRSAFRLLWGGMAASYAGDRLQELAQAWLRLTALGLLLYSVTQGAMFLSLFYLPAVTTSLLLSFTTVVVALLGLAWLNERPTWMQWSGTALYLVGVLVYFYPAQIPAGEVIGLIVAGVCVLGSALSTLLGRHINRSGTLEPMTSPSSAWASVRSYCLRAESLCRACRASR